MRALREPSTAVSGPTLVDAWARPVTDVRVSLTNRCNFHCLYCHNEGLGDTAPPRAPSHDEMTPAEVARLLRIGAEFGISKVKFTGGEPLLRSDLETIVAEGAASMEVSLTTNGTLLAHRARGLAEAGLSRVNVSVDSLDPVHFERIRRGKLAPVLRGIDAALEAGLAPVKVNTVVFDETLDELPDLLAFVATRPGLSLQLIELMPEIRHDVAPRRVAMERVRSWLEAEADAIVIRDMHHRRKYRVGHAWVEVVDPVGNAEFCANCHRIRITHDAKLKGCLNVLDDLVDTRGLDDDAVRDAYRRVVAARRPFYLPGSAPRTARGSIPVALRPAAPVAETE